MSEDYYPPWLHKDLIENTLPWQEATNRSFKDFLSVYTLHDSNWVGCFVDCGQQASLTLCIQWDSIWLPDGMTEKTSRVSNWPLLFIRIEGVVSFSLAGYGHYPDPICRTIGSCEIEKVQEHSLLLISDVLGGEVEIHFSGTTMFLALSRERKVLNIYADA